MPIQNIPGDTKEIRLRRWRVIEIEEADGTRSRHLCGHDVKNARGRASSHVVEFDRESMTAVTHSGSKYKLVGLPGNSRLGKGAWSRWCNENAVIAEVDVTNEYFNIDHLSTLELNKITTAAGQ